MLHSRKSFNNGERKTRNMQSALAAVAPTLSFPCSRTSSFLS